MLQSILIYIFQLNAETHLLEEWGVLSKVLRHNVEAKEMAVNALTNHCQSIHLLVFLSGLD